MIISGTITGVKPMSQQGYGPRNDIHYQDIQITDAQGQQHVGNIGTKAGYAVGSQIQVTVEQGQQGNKFKKYNPQYDNQQNQGGQQGFNQQQGSSQQPAKPQGRDFDKENRGKCRFGLYQAVVKYGVSPSDLLYNVTELKAIEELVEYSMNGLPQQPQQPHDPNETFNQAGGTDDIPF